MSLTLINSTKRLIMFLLCIGALLGFAGETAFAASSTKATITADNVNVRKKPDVESDSVARLKKGTSATILDRTGKWYYISADGVKGYVRDDMIIVKATSSQKLSISGKTNAEDVNLRAKADTSSNILTKLKKGTSVKVTEKVENWYKVTADGKSGYIRADYVTSSSSSSQSLKLGSEGSDVVTLQKALKTAGYYSGSADGKFGAGTEAAVINYQEKNKLTPDGVAGVATLSLLYGKKTSSSSSSTVQAAQVTKTPAVVPNNGIVELRYWSDVQRLIKRGMVFEVIDVRTNIRYKVKSLYGTYHADVETLTKNDTSLMLASYGGEWSWDRRPVWVIINGHYIAASTNGYPHGSDSIGDNGMNGQVCIHFRDSKVHRSGRVCPLHQTAVLEAYEKGGNVVTADMRPTVTAQPQDELDDDAHE